MQRIELNSLLIYTWTWGDVWVCFYTNRLTDTQTHRQTDRLTQDWSFTSDPVEWAPIWYFSAYLLHWNHLKKFIKWTTAILFPVAEWMSWNQAPPISRSISWRRAAQCRLLVLGFLPFWVHSPVSLCISGRVAPPKKTQFYEKSLAPAVI